MRENAQPFPLQNSVLIPVRFPFAVLSLGHRSTRWGECRDIYHRTGGTENGKSKITVYHMGTA